MSHLKLLDDLTLVGKIAQNAQTLWLQLAGWPALPAALARREPPFGSAAPHPVGPRDGERGRRTPGNDRLPSGEVSLLSTGACEPGRVGFGLFVVSVAAS